MMQPQWDHLKDADPSTVARIRATLVERARGHYATCLRTGYETSEWAVASQNLARFIVETEGVG